VVLRDIVRLARVWASQKARDRLKNEKAPVTALRLVVYHLQTCSVGGMKIRLLPGNMAAFDRLVRFRDSEGSIYSGEASGVPWDAELVGKTVKIYSSSNPWDHGFHLTDTEATISEVVSFRRPPHEKWLTMSPGALSLTFRASDPWSRDELSKAC
jgi:hypothetical protein